MKCLMRKSARCSKCGSSLIVENVRVVDRAHADAKKDLGVEIHENPDALAFRGTHQGLLHAWVCGGCGFVELYVSNPDELRAISSDKT